MINRFNILEREKIVEWSQKSLWDDEGKNGRNYLFNERDVSATTVRTFKLGYIPANVTHQLANRIIFPIYDASDNLVAVGTRLISGNSNLPVYWHEQYPKSFYLYGINSAKKRIRETGFTVVCEGNFDVLQCYDKNLRNVVGLMGTTMSEMQISLLLRYCENVIFIFDNDVNLSGQKGCKKVMKKFNSYSSALNARDEYEKRSRIDLLNIGFVQLPDCPSDPDDFIRKNGILPLKKLIKKGLSDLSTTPP